MIITNYSITPKIPIRRNQVLINTWHGGGAYKKVGLTNNTKEKKRVDLVFRILAKETTYFLSSCKIQTNAIHDTFHINKNSILTLGYPRNDIFFKSNLHLIKENEELLKKDHDGLSWLITSAINAFKQIKEQDNIYTCKQTRDETVHIYWGIDYLTKFLYLYTEYIDDLPKSLFISNQEITNSYIEYMHNQNKDVDTKNLSKEIGMKLNTIYPELKKKAD